MIKNMLVWPVSVWFVTAVAASLVIVCTDLACFWIPDLPVLLLGAANVAALAGGLFRPDPLVSLAAALFFTLLYVFFPGGMGSGDLKLFLALLPGYICCGVCVLVLCAFWTAFPAALAQYWLCRKKMLPFAPFLIVGWWFSLFWGKEWLQWTGI